MHMIRLQSVSELNDTPFEQVSKRISGDQQAYLIKEHQQAIGFFALHPLDDQVTKLTTFVITTLDQSENLVEMFYKIIEIAEDNHMHYLVVETDHQDIIELLTWIGFKHWKDECNTWGYSCG
ncbi:hypothetical protein [Amphibacillus cookii]|uniref:hypothetical protein n=1 Tax=Amphibacillus cookii TaxID=767787 RepID=UPI0019587F05|nr:hypothetical protein [Amphibacillus cookii]MBM7540829.1 hypothetical protein [Amphibacillus cookii]